MSADHHQQPLSRPRPNSAMVANPSVIAQRPSLKNVIPRSDRESGNVDVGVVLFDRPAFPIVVVIRMSQPVEEIGRERVRGVKRRRRIGKIEQRIAGERKLPHSGQSVCVLRDGSIEGVLRQARRPRFVEPLFEGAALVSPSVVVIAGGDHGADARQVRRMGDGCQHLCRAHVGGAKHSNLAIGIRQRRGPLYRVVAVIGFVFEGVPLAFGRIAAANVLKDDDESACCRTNAEVHAVVLVVRRALQQHGKFSVRRWPINISSENNAVAHLRFYATFDRYGICFGGMGNACDQNQAEGRHIRKNLSELHVLGEHGGIILPE